MVKGTAAQPGGLVVLETRAIMFFGDATLAHTAARGAIASLRITDFVRTIRQEHVCDAYAIQRSGRGWYLKFTVQPPVVVISLHPLEHATTTASGRMVEP